MLIAKDDPVFEYWTSQYKNKPKGNPGVGPAVGFVQTDCHGSNIECHFLDEEAGSYEHVKKTRLRRAVGKAKLLVDFTSTDKVTKAVTHRLKWVAFVAYASDGVHLRVETMVGDPGNVAVKTFMQPGAIGPAKRKNSAQKATNKTKKKKTTADKDKPTAKKKTTDDNSKPAQSQLPTATADNSALGDVVPTATADKKDKPTAKKKPTDDNSKPTATADKDKQPICPGCGEATTSLHNCPACKKPYHTVCMLSFDLLRNKICTSCYEAGAMSDEVRTWKPDTHLHDPFERNEPQPFDRLTRDYFNKKDNQSKHEQERQPEPAAAAAAGYTHTHTHTHSHMHTHTHTHTHAHKTRGLRLSLIHI